MVLDISKEKFNSFTAEQKELLKANFTFNRFDKCWHSVGLDLVESATTDFADSETGRFAPIAKQLGIFPTIFWAPSKEQYQGLSDDEKATVRSLFSWNKLSTVWVSKQDIGEAARDFLYGIGDKGNAFYNKSEIVTAKLQQGVAELKDGEEFKAFLRTMQKFPTYSIRNQILIALQAPNATRVASRSAWYKDFHRSVNSGAVGIQILAPEIAKMKQYSKEQIKILSSGGTLTEEEEANVPVKNVMLGFHPVTVYDVEETNGTPLPENPIMPNKLEGEVDSFFTLKEAIENVNPDFSVSYVPAETLKGANGLCDFSAREIKIADNLSQEQTLKTLLHETAHAHLHGSLEASFDITRADREMQAESTAFLLCEKYGIDSSDYTFGYVASWSVGSDTTKIAENIAVAATAAQEISSDIDKALDRILEFDFDDTEQDTDETQTYDFAVDDTDLSDYVDTDFVMELRM